MLAIAVMALCAAPSEVAASRNVWSAAPDSTIAQTTDSTPDPIAPDPTLVAVAGWWMVRRTDPDAEPMPRRDGQTGPPSDLI